MELFDSKKKIDEAISDPTVQREARRYSTRTRLAFLPDKVIGESWYFRLLTLIYYYVFVYYHGFEIVGLEKIDPKKGCLFISRHSTHNADLQATIIVSYHLSGRVIRSLIHRYVMMFFPLLRWMGAVPGERQSAYSLLKSGFWVGVIPGGAEEAMIGHENAYEVRWLKKRKGFAHIATRAQVPIVPNFMANQEEMRWNPFFYFWNLLGLGSLFSWILSLDIPIITPILAQIGMMLWFSLTWIQIPIPVKLTMYVGDPVYYDMSKDKIEDVVERSRNALQSLINRHQPYGKSYSNGVRQRIDSIVKYWTEILLNTNSKIQ